MANDANGLMVLFVILCNYQHFKYNAKYPTILIHFIIRNISHIMSLFRNEAL